LRGVAEDGGRVTIAIDHGDSRFPNTRLEIWDTRTGANRTPALWRDPEGERLLSACRHGWCAGMTDLLRHPAGQEFLTDEAAWAALRRRLTVGRAKALDDLRATVGPVEDSEAPDVFPRLWSLSPDGCHFAYVVRHGWPLYLISEDLGDGTVVEDVRTGARRAFLPGVTTAFHIAPGGRTGVSRNDRAGRDGEQPRLLLWDLDTGACRAGLLFPEVSNPFWIEYSADGRYVFARYWRANWSENAEGCRLRWWDAATGRQVGEVMDCGDTALLDGGRVLVTHPWRSAGSAMRERYLLGLWDVATGAPLGDWNLGAPADGSGSILRLVGSEDGLYLAAAYDPDYRRTPGAVRTAMDWLAGARAAAPPKPQHTLLLDVTRRRELARLPGQSAVFSRDGRWLATLDEAGVVRVWQVPVRPPWARILGAAAGATLACWAGLVLLARLGRRWRALTPAAARA
jgi:hypothetical protein